MLRFLALTFESSDTEASRAAGELTAALRRWRPAWTLVCEAPGLTATAILEPAGRDRTLGELARLIHARGGAGDSAAPCGVVFGEIFDRTNAPVGAFDAAAGRALAESRGQVLVDAYWGSWAAILRSDAGAVALRAPGGTLRYFHVRRGGVDLWFSDIEDAARLPGEPFSFDLPAVAASLINTGLVRNATGLHGVTELLGGQRLAAGAGGLTFDWPWRPAEAWRGGRVTDADAAADLMRRAVQGAVDAWAGGRRRILHRLSGGLDSSIVLGCLARAPSRPELTALTYFLPPELFGSSAAPASAAAASTGDERAFARLAAETAGAALLERERRPEHFDLAAVLGGRRTARPSWFAFSPDLDREDVRALQETGADALFTGRGGDGVFFASVRPWAAIDEAWERRLGPKLARLILDAGRTGRRSAWSVARVVLAQGLLRRPAPAAPPDPQLLGLLAPDAAQAATSVPARPWIALCEGLPPGKREQVHAFFGGHQYAEPFERGRIASVIDPLQSQPVIEAVLRIPTATMLAGGSRGLARRAFADRLPEAIRRRTGKGAGDAFLALVVRADGAAMRALLLDGVLSELGLLDRAGVEAAFAAQAARGACSGELLHLVGVEAWARRWRR